MNEMYRKVNVEALEDTEIINKVCRYSLKIFCDYEDEMRKRKKMRLSSFLI